MNEDLLTRLAQQYRASNPARRNGIETAASILGVPAGRIRQRGLDLEREEVTARLTEARKVVRELRGTESTPLLFASIGDLRLLETRMRRLSDALAYALGGASIITDADEEE